LLLLHVHDILPGHDGQRGEDLVRGVQQAGQYQFYSCHAHQFLRRAPLQEFNSRGERIVEADCHIPTRSVRPRLSCRPSSDGLGSVLPATLILQAALARQANSAPARIPDARLQDLHQRNEIGNKQTS